MSQETEQKLKLSSANIISLIAVLMTIGTVFISINSKISEFITYENYIDMSIREFI